MQVRGSLPSGGKSGKPVLPTTDELSWSKKRKGWPRPVGAFSRRSLPAGGGANPGSVDCRYAPCPRDWDPCRQQTPDVSAHYGKQLPSRTGGTVGWQQTARVSFHRTSLPVDEPTLSARCPTLLLFESFGALSAKRFHHKSGITPGQSESPLPRTRKGATNKTQTPSNGAAVLLASEGLHRITPRGRQRGNDAGDERQPHADADEDQRGCNRQ